MRRLSFVVASLLVLSACGDSLSTISRTDLVIESPGDGAFVFSGAPLTFRASAKNPGGIKSIQLQAGSIVVQTCQNTSDLTFVCEATIHLPDIAAQIQNGKLHLQAIATDVKKLTRTAGVNITVTPILIVFTQPVAQGTPSVATVKGTGQLSLDVQSEVPISSVQVRTADGLPVAGSLPAAGPYTTTLDWPLVLGLGPFQLQAQAQDIQGRMSTATLAVQVLCAQDADCAVHQRCCTTTGACEAMTVMPACQ